LQGIHSPIQNFSRFVHLNFGCSSPVTITSPGKESIMTTLSPSEQGQTFTVPRLDVHDLVTTIIISQLEQGIIPWQSRWINDKALPFNIPYNCTTGNRYNGINILLLWSSVLKNEYTTDGWASFKQWQKQGESIRKGEKGSLVVYYDAIEKEEDGELVKIPFLKSSYVFNRCQLLSYDSAIEASAEPQAPKVDFERNLAVDLFIQNTKAVIKYHNGGAMYNRVTDEITLPHAENFIDTEMCTASENYIATLFHELVHWSGAPKRLNRIKGEKFGDQNYANEELVAELGAAFLCSGFGLPTTEKAAHSAYINNWLQVLREDKKCIFRAAGAASKAVEYLYKL
jgi:antirestriction protein ArdC